MKEEIKKILSDKTIPPDERLDTFCNFCWIVEQQSREELYSIIVQSFSDLPQEDKKRIIPKLEKASYKYNPLIILAYNLLTAIPKWERDEIHLYGIGWTYDDNHTLISQEEYRWRYAHNFRCRKEGTVCTRPSCINDFICFEKSLKMLSMTNSHSLVFHG